MAPKRNAHEAFGNTISQKPLSAFAAARLAKHVPAYQAPLEDRALSLDATSLAQVPYDGTHEDTTSDVESQPVDSVLTPMLKPTTIVRSPTHGKGAVEEGPDGRLTITLRNNETAAYVGEYDLRVLEGIATIYGAVLTPTSSPRRVYAPSTHALPVVIGRRDGTVVQISHVESTMRALDKLSPLFRNIWRKEDDPTRTFQPLQNPADDESQHSLLPLEVDQRTEMVLSRLATEVESTARLTRIMAVGAKSSGKSTFNRILCNALISKPSLRKLLYLDLDPGQAEFGPSGQLSLVEVTAPILGPPFTHPACARSPRYRLLRAHTIAATSFKDDPAHYVACATELVQHADRQYPLVVNSCGWVSGLGASVLQDLTQALSITQVVLLEPLDAGLTAALQTSCSDATFHRLSRQPVRPTARTPAESRSMQTMAYFHHRAAKPTSEPRWSSKAISNRPPWLVSYDGPHAGIQAIISYGTQPHPDFLAETLDGSLVALVRLDAQYQREVFNPSHHTATLESSTDDSSESATATPSPGLIKRTKDGLPYIRPTPTGATAPLDPRFSECVSLALVRGIDTQNKFLQLVTPLSESQVAVLMDQPLVIVRGSFDAPEWAYLEDLHLNGRESGVKSERPWVSRTEAVGIEGAVWRLRHPPLASDMR
ncbi:Polynucleotide 5'-hydroxyl-kinase grc3 [Friedmanniomyces endolithicus]|nr:Polynucleotide 5'-hydroxyl-kinase grc3 [Friedmanniomyces endolithicus]KAK0853096.1 Polynucleotide 5'-hydroxyl-kinase grc3 [Friedmanniomyces endolithicus]